MLPLGFRFDVDAVVIGGVAHRSDCDQINKALADDGVDVFAGGVHRAEWCPRVCPKCRPLFETLLSYQLQDSIGAVGR